MCPFRAAVMIAKTFFLAKGSHRISPLSLREKLSLRDHDNGRCPAYLVYGTNAVRVLRIPAETAPVSPGNLGSSLETSHYVELPHLMRVFSFHAVQSFRDNHPVEQGWQATSGRTDTRDITFPLTERHARYGTFALCHLMASVYGLVKRGVVRDKSVRTWPAGRRSASR